VEIKYASQCSQRRHYLGSLNLADKASHSIPAKRQLTSETWFKGPAFLMKLEEDWPCFEIGALPEDQRAIFTLTREVLLLDGALTKDGC